MSIALPGGASTNEKASSQVIKTASKDPKTVLKQFISFISCLNLSETELSALGSTLKDSQIQKISKYLTDPLLDGEVQISHMVQLLSLE